MTINLARKIVKKLGGEKIVATLLGLKPAAVYRWYSEKEKQGAGGVIPTKHWQPLIHHAKKCNIDVTEEDFMSFYKLVYKRRKKK